MSRRHALVAYRKLAPGTSREHKAGGSIRCLVLASGPEEWAGVDLRSGAIVRLHPGAAASFAERADEPVAALDVVELRLAEDPDPLDPGRPEAVVPVGLPTRRGRRRTRQARRVLRSLVPSSDPRPLLGVIGPSAPYADLEGAKPSVVLVRPDRRPEIVATDGAVWCSFGLSGADERLPVADARAVAAACAIPGTVLSAAGIAAMIGHPVHYLLVALLPPRGGHASKAVIGLLPRP
jgi:hypothetical protein